MATINDVNIKKMVSIMGNKQYLDGGAMFGNVPKAMWEKWVDIDEQNRILLGCRALYVELENKKVLFEAGIGNFFEPKLKARFGIVEDTHVLLDNLANIGVKPEDIDVIVLSHLHFDHVGGLLSSYQEGEPLALVFSNAHYVVSQDAWHRAQNPHFRDKASFLPQLNQLLQDSGRMEVVSGEFSSNLGRWVKFHISEGHTPGMLLSEIDSPTGKVFFAADLIPGKPWVHLPVTMGYDRYPEKLIDEKRQFLHQVMESKGRVFFTHDPQVACAEIIIDEQGRYSTAKQWQQLDYHAEE